MRQKGQKGTEEEQKWRSGNMTIRIEGISSENEGRRREGEEGGGEDEEEDSIERLKKTGK